MNPKRIVVITMALLTVVSMASVRPVIAQSDWLDTLGRQGNGFGCSVSDAGDVDGDGKGDVIIGSPIEAKIFVLSGATGSFIYIFAYFEDYGGFSVSGAGDVDGDGRSDVIGGAPFYGGVPPNSIGKATVFSGSTGDSIWSFYGDSVDYLFGWSVSGAGDVDGDGRPDLVIGARRGLGGRGKAYIFSGRTGYQLYVFSGDNPYFGSSVAGAGDVDDDGRADVVIGDPYANRAYVFSGRTGDTLWVFSGAGVFGASVSGAGDVDADGHTDIIVGAPSADIDTLTGCGKAYVFSGVDGHIIWEWNGEASYDRFGHSVSGAGDVDIEKDGRADLIVGAPEADPFGLFNAGKAYVFSGRTGEILCEFNGDYVAAGFGYSVSGAGDVNLDGKDDVIVGAPIAEHFGDIPGEAKVYSGVSCSTLYSFCSPVVDLTAPDGHECWLFGETHDITWTSYCFTDSVKLEYSTNGGATWLVLEEGTENDGLYSWTIPNTPSSDCFVKVSMKKDRTVYDASDHVFFIGETPDPVITLLTPGPGWCWKIGGLCDIRWDWQCLSDSVQIWYSTNSGAPPWKPVTEGCTLNDGLFRWSVPDDSSENARVKISDCSGAACDSNEEDFFISPIPTTAIVVTSPNGGETICADSIYLVTWSRYCFLDSIKVEYSTVGDTLWDSVAVVPNTGSYAWSVPHTHLTDCLIRLADAKDGSPSDTSDNAFTIDSIGVIEVTSPNGGETWTGGSQHYIEWLSHCGFAGDIRIEYSINSGVDFDTIVSSCPNTGQYLWTVPCTPSNYCRVRVCDATDCDPADTSDADFAITECIPVLTNYGIIVLLILLMASAIWMLKRRRLATGRNN